MTCGLSRAVARRDRWVRTAFLFLVVAMCLIAHNGPPFPMISEQRMGRCTVSLWTHPDVGAGTFFVVVSPASGMRIPKDITFEIGVLPKSGRLPEKLYSTTRQEESGQTRYYARVPFDKEELWRVNLYMRSSAGSGEISGDVQVTPAGFGQWDLLFFSSPFLGIGLLWFIAVKRKGTLGSKRVSASKVTNSGPSS